MNSHAKSHSHTPPHPMPDASTRPTQIELVRTQHYAESAATQAKRQNAIVTATWMLWFLHVMMHKQPTLLDSHLNGNVLFSLTYKSFCMFWSQTASTSGFEPDARNVLFCLTKPTKSPCFLDSQVFPSRPQGTSLHHCRNCAKAKNLPQKKHARNHMRYRHQKYPASSKDQEHNRSKQMSLGSTIMSQCCHVQADQAVTNPYRLLTSTSCMPAEPHVSYKCCHATTVMQLLSCRCCKSKPAQAVAYQYKLLTANTNMMHGCSNTSSVPRDKLALAWACLTQDPAKRAIHSNSTHMILYSI